jgi:hypothetical protein
MKKQKFGVKNQRLLKMISEGEREIIQGKGISHAEVVRRIRVDALRSLKVKLNLK